jgi:hypothetical protein
VTVRFTAGVRRPAARQVTAVVVEGGYWVAEAPGGWSRVAVRAGPVLMVAASATPAGPPRPV